jgi:hypothetical protein
MQGLRLNSPRRKGRLRYDRGRKLHRQNTPTDRQFKSETVKLSSIESKSDVTKRPIYYKER